jgi:phosphoglycerate kinase
VLLGGAKVSDKLGTMRNILACGADTMLIGGGIANTFLKALGHEIGDSLVEDDMLEEAKALLEENEGKIILPVDVVVGDAFSNDADHKVVSIDGVEPGWSIYDIGPKTVELYKSKLEKAEMVAWGGPMGVFEMPNFAKGTFAIAEVLAEIDAVTLVGGGESGAAVQKAGVADKVSHVSTGGGASLRLLEGKELPGLEALEDK